MYNTGTRKGRDAGDTGECGGLRIWKGSENGSLAQLAERMAVNHEVIGSSPIGIASIFHVA